MRREVHPIEAESYRIMRSLVDLSHLGPLSRAVAERVIHASADLEYARSLLLDEAALRRGLRALRSGAPLVADARMVAAGITARESLCLVSDERVRDLAAREGITRSAAGFRLAFRLVGPGAVWVVGNAPTALFELLDLGADPALVVGLPVGFVGAAESKAALAASDLPSLTNVGTKGGSAVAAAAVNALLYFEGDEVPENGFGSRDGGAV
ncbi:Precorrin isomerase [Rubrobacter radiotolerans]|uniref:Precorrin isomerase n=1 Tax=Rubrobacter radiotolerans TaxID=42256 RepID=A0A023X1P9_RUBRA|nr:precorrin-8X methylmutase [Rubrobacter radiotolerans]AHY46106.1 Precorrin isomerase [Rubrobacter radiotolerans]MDX5893516.1 precorrin-8X methylmutase [Rubrobacter radiotolerans]SMC03902.1 precorrin-8X methylmutase [Rubrobacter radiotolerans DSM 5868]